MEVHRCENDGFAGLYLVALADYVERRSLGKGVGAMVMGVDNAGPGAAAGLRQGDVIVGWNGEALRGVRALLVALGPDSVGTTAELSLRRAGEPVSAKLTIGERPAA